MEKILPFWIIVAPLVWALADYMMASKSTTMSTAPRTRATRP